MKKYIILFLYVVAVSLLLGKLTSSINVLYILLILAAVVFLGIAINNIKYGIVLLLILRSSIDSFADNAIKLGGINLNIATLVATFCILMVFGYILLRKVYIYNSISMSHGIFILVCILTIMIPGNVHSGNLEIFKYISIAAVYIIVYYLCSEIKGYDKLIVKSIIISSVIPLIVGLYQIVFKKGFTTNFYSEIGLNRARGTLVHPNAFAFYLLIIIVAIFFYIKTYKISVVFCILGVLSLFELYYTYTRGAWLGLVIMIVSYVFLSKTSIRNKIIFMVSLLIISVPVIQLTSSRFTNVLSSNMELSSFATRIDIWKGMVTLFKGKPIFGYGIGSFVPLNLELFKINLNAHNDYLRLLIETGLVGVLSFIGIQISALKAMVSLKKKNYIIIFILLGTFCILSAADNIIDMTVCEWYIWALVAIVTSKKNSEIREKNILRIG